jgi:large subunit ribosomal protein L25
MSVEFTLNAQARDGQGKGATRRLRRAGLVPAIVYGADKEPTPIALESRVVKQSLAHEAVFSHILTLNVDGASERVILKGLQRHPASAAVMHIDLQRVSEDEEIRVRVPLHFLGEDKAPGVRLEHGIVSHMFTEVEVSCLPKDLPEFIDVDVSALHLHDTLHLSDLRLPPGVELVDLGADEEHDTAVVAIQPPRTEREETEEVVAAEGAEAGGAAAVPSTSDEE